MNKTAKKLWLKALRSGNFRQARGHMRVSKRSNNDIKESSNVPSEFFKEGGRAHCCLGVLTEVAQEQGVVSKFSTAGNRNTMPCRAVYAWAELDRSDADDLASKNDRGDNDWPTNDFANIADFIEENL